MNKSLAWAKLVSRTELGGVFDFLLAFLVGKIGGSCGLAPFPMQCPMPTKSKKSNAQSSERFQQTRGSHARETAEDYVEAIADLTEEKGSCRGVDLARLFHVTQVTISKTVTRLQAEGLVDFDPYGPLSLTSAGAKLAAHAKHRHVVVLHFLRSIGVSEETAQVDAEGIEHHVSPETLAAFQKLADKLSNSNRKSKS